MSYSRTTSVLLIALAALLALGFLSFAHFAHASDPCDPTTEQCGDVHVNPNIPCETFGWVGTPGNCVPPPHTCPAGYSYDAATDTCVSITTPPPTPSCADSGQIGTYPNCTNPPPPSCPVGQVGTYPNCTNPPPQCTPDASCAATTCTTNQCLATAADCSTYAVSGTKICAPACVANQGTSCTSGANSCGMTNSGTIACDGSCSASVPSNNLCPQQPSCVANQGTSCTSGANSCGMTNSGTIACNGSCSAATPPDSSCAAQNPSGPSAVLDGTPNVVASGHAATLSWSSSNATSCTGAGFSTGGAPSGSRSTGPLTTTTSYGLACSGPGGSVNAQPVTISVVGGACGGAASAAISANPMLLAPGQITALTASATNVNGTCTLTGTNGFHTTVSPDSCSFVSAPIASPPATTQTKYTLSCPSALPVSVIVNVTGAFKEF